MSRMGNVSDVGETCTARFAPSIRTTISRKKGKKNDD